MGPPAWSCFSSHFEQRVQIGQSWICVAFVYPNEDTRLGLIVMINGGPINHYLGVYWVKTREKD